MNSRLKKILYCIITICIMLVTVIGLYVKIKYVRVKHFQYGEIITSINKLQISEEDRHDGIFTYGPYFELDKGNYIVTINYKTDSDLNEYDVIYNENDTQYSITKGKLDKEKESISFDINPKYRLRNVEIRTIYNGTGNLKIEDISIKSKNIITHLTKWNILLILSGTFFSLILWLFYTLKKIDSYTYKKIFRGLSSEKYKFILPVIIIMSIIACLPYFQNGLAKAHDITFHLNRIQGIKDSLLSGQFPAKIYPILKGYGYANGIFYPDIFLYFPALLNIGGIGLNLSYKIFIFICTILAAISMYYCIYRITKSDTVALATSIVYILAPYRLEDVLIRAAVGEILSFIFIPLIIAGIYEIIWGECHKKWLLIIGAIGVCNSHILSIVIVASMVILFVMIKYKVFIKDRKRMLELIKAAIWCLVLTCNIWMPILEQLLSQEFVVNHAGNSYKLIETALPLSIMLGLKSGALPINGGNKMVYMPYFGIHIIILSGLVIYSIKESKNKINSKIINFKLVSVIVGICFLIIASRIFPWKLVQNICGTIQFPWRFLMVATTVLVFAIGISFTEVINKNNKIITIIAISLVSIIFAYPILNEAQNKDRDIRFIRSMGVSAGEYLPYQTDKSKLEEAGDKKLYYNNSINILNYSKNGMHIKFDFSNNNNSYVEVPMLYYKGYSAYINGKEKINVSKGNNNLVRVDISKYKSGHLQVYYKGTFCQKISLLIEILAIAYLLIKFILKRQGGQLWKKYQ